MTNDRKPADFGDAIQITLPVKGTTTNPAHVQLGQNNDFHVEVQVDPDNNHTVGLVWAVAYLEGETEPSTAIGTQSLDPIQNTDKYEGTLTLNACDEKFGIVATAEISDSATSETLDPVNNRSRLKYFGDCAEIRQSQTRRPAGAAKKKKAGAAARKSKKVMKKKAKKAVKKARKK